MVAVTGGFKYLFGNDLPIVRDLRNLSLTSHRRRHADQELIIQPGGGAGGGFAEAGAQDSLIEGTDGSS